MGPVGGVISSHSGGPVLPETVPPLLNVLTVDVEEYYHGVEFTAAMSRSQLRQLPSRVVPSTEGLLDLCDAHGARGTFFVLGTVAQRYPRLVRTIVERGHEIAAHGWDHTLVDALGPTKFREDVRRTKRMLEQAAGQPVWGYRAPNYSIRRDTPWAFSTLWEEGYAYDSSIHPIVHDRYGFPDAPRFPHVAVTVDGADFWEVPVGTARVAGTNLPIGGGFFRLFPLSLLRGALHSINRRDRRPAVLYVHPWEFDPGQPRPAGMSFMHRFRHYVGLTRSTAKLGRLLTEFAFTSIAMAFPQVRPARRLHARSAAS
jgi:polysaccharide deacetylase family protein (PEP-CTERM system associated)